MKYHEVRFDFHNIIVTSKYAIKIKEELGTTKVGHLSQSD